MTPDDIFFEKVIRLGLAYHPVLAEWEVTSRCNADCGYCYVKNPAAIDLPTSAMLDIADKIGRSGALNLAVSGGEASLRNDLTLILDRLVSYDFFGIALLTNGIDLSLGLVDYIIAHKTVINFVQISMFSHIAEENDRFLGYPGAFAAQLRNAELLKKGGIDVAIALNVLEFNLGRLRETLDFFKARSLKCTVAYQRLISEKNRKNGIDPRLNESQVRELLRQFGDQTTYAAMRDPHAKKPAIDQYFPCAAPVSSFAVTSAGDVLPCVGLRRLRLGNMLEHDSLEELLRNSSEYERFRQSTSTPPDKCAACCHWDYCSQCMALNETDSGDYRVPGTQLCLYADMAKELSRALE